MTSHVGERESVHLHVYIYIYIYTLKVGGGESVVKPPTGKSFRFDRACERARRGEAVLASERRFDPIARAVARPIDLVRLLLRENHAG